VLDYHWVSYSFPIKIPTFRTRPAAQNRPKSAAVPSCRARCSRGVRTSETSEGSSLVFCLSLCGMCLQVAEIAIFLVKKIWKWIFSTLRTTYTHFKKESDFPMKRTLRCGILPLPGWSRWGSPQKWIVKSLDFGIFWGYLVPTQPPCLQARLCIFHCTADHTRQPIWTAWVRLSKQ